ncbi:hypothetical protein L1049_022130 [Liquidambar formosana]|uniref:Uncharacterized protein n=1 Tax=Liquidambar formosana TaxID=63359 RepID=A0AAP0RDU4_LIQFO
MRSCENWKLDRVDYFGFEGVVLPSLIAELESSARADKKEEYVTAINEEIRMLHMEMKEQKEKIEAEERKLEELAEKLKARERVRLQLLRGTMPSLQN